MRRILSMVLTAAIPLTAAIAQNPERVNPEQTLGAGRAGAPQPGRAKLEQELRRRVGERARKVLNLTDDQFGKLQQVDARYETQQRALDVRENETRRGLRETLTAPPSTDQERRAGELFDQLLSFQHQRLDAIQAEQKDLSGFLSNTQRARYQILRENIRRQLEDVIAPGAGRRGGRPPTR